MRPLNLVSMSKAGRNAIARTVTTAGMALCLAVTLAAAHSEETMVKPRLFDRPNDLAENVPATFTRFHFRGGGERAQLLNRYLWYHFSNRLGNGNTLFNKEYLTTADMWLGGAVDKARGKSIQDVHREDLSSIKLDREGYVYTHQHISHTHDHGWPFPLWTQADQSADLVAGKAVGWHFQANPRDLFWTTGYLKGWNKPQYYGLSAIEGWELHNVKSLGIADEKWQLEATGESPSITTPAGMELDSFQSPYLQLRWVRSQEPFDTPSATQGSRATGPYVEWLCEGDEDFGADRRVYAAYDEDTWMHVTHSRHLMFEMYRHPKWTGHIKRMRIVLAPGESEGKFGIDSFFTVYDTRHTINNPIFIMACWNYFLWTGDIAFLRENINRMRAALQYQQTVMGGLRYNRIRVPWPGHDGLAGWVRNPDGSKTIRGGHGIGNNYWDIMPFGWDDMYATNQYYASLLVMADAEEAIAANPGWGMPKGAFSIDPDGLRKHAADVKGEANRLFWNSRDGRFVACIDKEGHSHDFGFTFLNLDSIWYDLASDEHARSIMDWIEGRRIVKGDTSTGADIYHWRFGPRATTKRNEEWYGQSWTGPETLPWGGQVQDGGAVLGFAFYDLWARLKLRGPDDAWRRLAEMLDWEKDVYAEGGYRAYYQDGKHGTTLQGGGTAGGLGIDCEFFESSLIPSIVIYGFLGARPQADGLRIAPALPSDVPEMGISDLLYHGCRLDVRASERSAAIAVKQKPLDAVRIILDGQWKLSDTGAIGNRFEFAEPGVYTFERVSS